MALLYADENFDYPVVEFLRQLGHGVLTVQEAGRRGSISWALPMFGNACCPN